MVWHIIWIKFHKVPFLVPGIAVTGNKVMHAHGVFTANAHQVPWYLYPASLFVVWVQIDHKEHAATLVFALLEVGQYLVIFYMAEFNVVCELQGFELEG